MSVTLEQTRPKVSINQLGGVTFRKKNSTVNLTQSAKVVLHQRRSVVTVIGGKQGIAGVNGGNTESFTAAVSLGGQRAVGLNSSNELVYADATLLIRAIGILRDAVTAGDTANVYVIGRVNGHTGLTYGTIYLNDNGLYSITPSTTGLYQPLGTIATSSEILVDIGQPILL
jgi:hypothetical protein